MDKEREGKILEMMALAAKTGKLFVSQDIYDALKVKGHLDSAGTLRGISIQVLSYLEKGTAFAAKDILGNLIAEEENFGE